jgi:hypothetical protein
MAIAEIDLKLLWGRSAGICSNPGCRKELTLDLDMAGSLNIGEMAHVIARQPAGPRGDGKGGNNSYDNLILLCPSCHTLVDKAPADFSEEKLRSWKTSLEAKVRTFGKTETYPNIGELKATVTRLLIENRQIWSDFGPKSDAAEEDPGSNLAIVWNLKKLNTIVPNNTRIINIIETNAKLLTPEQYELYVRFKAHATAFEQNQYHRLDRYPLFPKEFEREFKQ